MDDYYVPSVGTSSDVIQEKITGTDTTFTEVVGLPEALQTATVSLDATEISDMINQSATESDISVFDTSKKVTIRRFRLKK